MPGRADQPSPAPYSNPLARMATMGTTLPQNIEHTSERARVCNKRADLDPGAVQATPGTALGIRPGQGPGGAAISTGAQMAPWQTPGFVAKRIESNSVTSFRICHICEAENTSFGD